MMIDNQHITNLKKLYKKVLSEIILKRYKTDALLLSYWNVFIGFKTLDWD